MNRWSKRGCLLAVSFGLALTASFSQSLTAPNSQKAQASGNPVASTNGKTLLLWPEGAPKAVGKTPAETPTLTVFLPAKNTTRTGVVIAPGGGYLNLSMKHEGEDIARWLNARGVAAFVLKYRLGPVYHHPIELGDAQRSLRLVRANAKEEYLLGDDPAQAVLATSPTRLRSQRTLRRRLSFRPRTTAWSL